MFWVELASYPGPTHLQSDGKLGGAGYEAR